MLDPKGWRNNLRNCLSAIECDDSNAYEKIISLLDKGTIFFVGNGGSAAIASHMAIDYTKNGEYKAMAFNDAAAITCLSNDFRYQEIFKFQMRKWATKNDILFAISSSGESPSILNAATEALKKESFVVTLSAFKPDNPLRKMGNINFYVPTMEYGFAEITHLSILHSILDLAMKEKT
jgi:D-sedoheptulose 7-phosphate isomerase